MITPDYAAFMARYNRWQNTSLIRAADTIDDAARRLDRGAFFGSIFRTFNHVLWGDSGWLSRLGDWPAPTVPNQGSPGFTEDWPSFLARRAELDSAINDWAAGLDQARLDGDLTWHARLINREFTQPFAQLVVHFFNHQTHHRGQIHAMLTAAGAKPDDTDIPLMPRD